MESFHWEELREALNVEPLTDAALTDVLHILLDAWAPPAHPLPKNLAVLLAAWEEEDDLLFQWEAHSLRTSLAGIEPEHAEASRAWLRDHPRPEENAHGR